MRVSNCLEQNFGRKQKDQEIDVIGCEKGAKLMPDIKPMPGLASGGEKDLLKPRNPPTSVSYCSAFVEA